MRALNIAACRESHRHDLASSHSRASRACCCCRCAGFLGANVQNPKRTFPVVVRVCSAASLRCPHPLIDSLLLLAIIKSHQMLSTVVLMVITYLMPLATAIANAPAPE